jgi:hypothetical protein
MPPRISEVKTFESSSQIGQYRYTTYCASSFNEINPRRRVRGLFLADNLPFRVRLSEWGYTHFLQCVKIDSSDSRTLASTGTKYNVSVFTAKDREAYNNGEGTIFAKGTAEDTVNTTAYTFSFRPDEGTRGYEVTTIN